ncbi:hypothetical protein IF2G_11143 [Cordyceps javanica]|nr:hypothetical protein IF2G_11143 [Cordyceps javanica]
MVMMTAVGVDVRWRIGLGTPRPSKGSRRRLASSHRTPPPTTTPTTKSLPHHDSLMAHSWVVVATAFHRFRVPSTRCRSSHYGHTAHISASVVSCEVRTASTTTAPISSCTWKPRGGSEGRRQQTGWPATAATTATPSGPRTGLRVPPPPRSQRRYRLPLPANRHRLWLHARGQGCAVVPRAPALSRRRHIQKTGGAAGYPNPRVSWRGETPAAVSNDERQARDRYAAALIRGDAAVFAIVASPARGAAGGRGCRGVSDDWGASGAWSGG